jgi:hypothetical protein
MTVRVKPFTLTLNVAEPPGDAHPVVVAAALGELVDALTPTSVTHATTIEIIAIISRLHTERIMTSPCCRSALKTSYAT